MRRFLLIISVVLTGLHSFAQINSYPYYEDFESGKGSWIDGGTNQTIGLGIPKGSFISVPAPGGQYSWVTNPNGNHGNSEVSVVESPVFDFTGVDTPVVRMYNIYQTEDQNDYMRIQFSINGGGWVNLGSSVSGGENWYQDGLNRWYNMSGEAGDWKMAEHKLVWAGGSMGGETNVRLRFYFQSDASIIREGSGFDNVLVYDDDDLTDIMVTSIDSIKSECGLSSEKVSCNIKNTGTTTVNSFDIHLELNTGYQVTSNISTTLNPGQTYLHSFTGVDFSDLGDHIVSVSVDLAGDQYPANDSMVTIIANQPVISSYPYIEDFESDNGGYFTDGVSSSWDHGNPKGLLINQAASGNECWATNLLGTYNVDETSYLNTACFDFSGFVTDPTIRFNHIYSTEGCCDHGWIEYSENGGAWTTLGSMGTGTNWYNDPGDVWNGNSGGTWQIAEHTLSGLAGSSNVKLRFVLTSDGSVTDEGFGIDDILIFDTLTDIRVVSIDGPNTGCGLGASENVMVTIQNMSTSAKSNIDVYFQLDGGAYFSTNVSGPIAPFGTQLVTFGASPVDLSAEGEYTIKAFVSYGGDLIISNDTLSGTIAHQSNITTFPYLMDFESNNGLWVKDGNSPSWGYGNIAKNVISNAASGTKAWSTGGTSNQEYFNYEHSYIVSPCFDFSAMTNPHVGMNIWWVSEYHTDGTIMQYSINDGVSWNTIGSFGEPNNWYNDNVISSAPDGSIEGWGGNTFDGNSSNGWVSAWHQLTALAGQSSVKFRFVFASDGSLTADGFAFDDFEIGEPPTPDLGNDTTGCVMELDATRGMVVNTSFSYLWSTGDTTSNLWVYNFTAVTIMDTITVAVSNTFGTSYDTIILTLDPTPFVDLGADTAVCLTTNVLLDATTAGVSYSWQDLSGAPTFTATTTGIYWVEVTDLISTCSYRDSILVQKFSGAPSANYTVDASGGLSVVFTDASINGFYSDWDFGDGGSSTALNPSHTYLTEGTYTITLIVDNGCGEDTVTKTFGFYNVGMQSIESNKEEITIVPNPNNGSFYIAGDYRSFDYVEIYSEIGQLILREQLLSNASIDISNYENGFYIAVFVGQQEILTKKVIKNSN